MVPLIPGFRATTKTKAFALNALVSAVVIVLTIQVKASLDGVFDKDAPRKRISLTSLLLTFVICFIVAFVSYGIMFLLFGYGGGMLIEGA
tara:strand:- start:257 stop:526 length:270 start_codon:yes stop_codon:yes gene_type:complete